MYGYSLKRRHLNSMLVVDSNRTHIVILMLINDTHNTNTQNNNSMPKSYHFIDVVDVKFVNKNIHQEREMACTMVKRYYKLKTQTLKAPTFWKGKSEKPTEI